MDRTQTDPPRADALEGIFRVLAEIDQLGPGHLDASLQIAWEAHRVATIATLLRSDAGLHISTLASITASLTGSSAPACLAAAQRAIVPQLPQIVLESLRTYLASARPAVAT